MIMEKPKQKFSWILSSVVFAIATVFMITALTSHLNTLYVDDNVDNFYPYKSVAADRGQDYEVNGTMTWDEHCSTGIIEGVHPIDVMGLLDCDSMYEKTYDYSAKLMISFGLFLFCLSQRN